MSISLFKTDWARYQRDDCVSNHIQNVSTNLMKCQIFIRNIEFESYKYVFCRLNLTKHLISVPVRWKKLTVENVCRS